MRGFTRNELLALTPARYLADGFGDAVALMGECATAAAHQLLAGEVAPQELAFSVMALDQAYKLHDGDPASRTAAALEEALQVAARMIRQPNNIRLVQWLNECAAHVRLPGDIEGLQAHLQSVLRQYALIASLAGPQPSPSLHLQH